MVVLQGVATDQVSDYDASLAIVAVLEADDDQPVPGEAASPAIMAIFLADLGCCDKLEIAVCADVVVAFVALQTMETGHRGRDWIGADIAFGGKGEDLVALLFKGD
jgi:hypothetical protein